MANKIWKVTSRYNIFSFVGATLVIFGALDLLDIVSLYQAGLCLIIMGLLQLKFYKWELLK